MNWIKSKLIQLVLRHVANGAGAWFIAKGFVTNDDMEKLYGALAVLAAIGHSIWDKRATIISELQKLKGDNASLLVALALPCLLFTGCKTPHQVVNFSKGTGLNMNLPVGYNGANLLELNLKVGQFYTATAVQPVFTNAVYVPGVAFASTTDGTVTAPQIGGTNYASVVGGDKFTASIGDAAGSISNLVGNTTSVGK